MKYAIFVFTLTCDRLNRVKVRNAPMDFEFVEGGDSQPGCVDLACVHCGNVRSAQVSFDPPNAYATFDNLMKFDLFDSALESHGFTTSFEY